MILFQFADPRNPNAKSTISFNEFLRRHEKMLVEQVAYWHGEPS